MPLLDEKIIIQIDAILTEILKKSRKVPVDLNVRLFLNISLNIASICIILYLSDSGISELQFEPLFAMLRQKYDVLDAKYSKVDFKSQQHYSQVKLARYFVQYSFSIVICQANSVSNIGWFSGQISWILAQC